MTVRNQSTIIRVFVSDAQPLLSETLRVALATFPDIEPIDEHAAIAVDAIEAVKRHDPHVVVLDYWMPGIDGPGASSKVLTRLRGFKVIFLSWFYANKPWFDAPGDIERVLAAGAVGFLPKHCRVQHVAEAIREANHGEAPVMQDYLDELLGRMKGRRKNAGEIWEQLARLTPREIEILQVLADGMSVTDAAAALFISPATMRTHVQRILHKTGTHSQVAAIAKARNYGIIRG